MSAFEYTLSGFGDFLERRRVTFVNALPSLRVCSVCGIVPSRTLLVSCGQVLCEPCTAQIKDEERCPFDDGGCFEANVTPLNFTSCELDKLLVLCPNSCDFTGNVSELKEHLANCFYDRVKCPKCSEPIRRNVAVVHRRHCSGVFQTVKTASTAEADSNTIEDLRGIRKDLEVLLVGLCSQELDDYDSSTAQHVAVKEHDCNNDKEEPPLAHGECKLMTTATQLPIATTPHRAASRPNVFVTLCSFCRVYETLTSLRKDGGDSIKHAPIVLGGYSFQIQCVLEMDSDEKANLHFTLRLRSGAWDDRVPWPFNREVTIILSHPTDPKRDVKLPVTLSHHNMSRKPAPGCMNDHNSTDEVPWTDIESNGFLDDGTIYVNVELA
ncbi:hypothetical protein MTO96_024753 [Rhipicephalus appendiculatus]